MGSQAMDAYNEVIQKLEAAEERAAALGRRLEEERASCMRLARRLEPNPGSGEDSLRGPGAYYRGMTSGLTIAIDKLNVHGSRDALEGNDDE